MFGTKLEITLPKAEPGAWSKLNFPRETAQQIQSKNEDDEKITDAKISAMSNTSSKPVQPKKAADKQSYESDSELSDVDLDDIEITAPSSEAALGNFQLMEDV